MHTRAVRDTAEDETLPEPAPVRQLRRLVSLLIIVLIAGVLTVSITLVIRLKSLGGGEAGLQAVIAAPGLAVPPGEAVVALGRAGAEILLLTRAGDGAETLRAYDAATGEPRSATPIRRD